MLSKAIQADTNNILYVMYIVLFSIKICRVWEFYTIKMFTVLSIKYTVLIYAANF